VGNPPGKSPGKKKAEPPPASARNQQQGKEKRGKVGRKGRGAAGKSVMLGGGKGNLSGGVPSEQRETALGGFGNRNASLHLPGKDFRPKKGVTFELLFKGAGPQKRKRALSSPEKGQGQRCPIAGTGRPKSPVEKEGAQARNRGGVSVMPDQNFVRGDNQTLRKKKGV